MAIKVVPQIQDVSTTSPTFQMITVYIDTVNHVIVNGGMVSATYGTDIVLYTLDELVSVMTPKIITDAAGLGFTITSADIIWMTPNVLSPEDKALIQAATVARTQSQATRSLVTGTGATGFQVSSTRDALVSYNATIVSTATIAGAQSGTVVLEVASTNSATAGDWKEVARFTNGQALSLAITLQSVQTMAGNLTGFIPKGYYAKLRTINNLGTPSFSYNSGQEMLM